MRKAVERMLGPEEHMAQQYKLVKTPFPGRSTPIPQLYTWGDSTFPGTVVPAVAASGAIVANSLVSVSQHSELLDAIGI
ncbi:hypothetical protein Pint_32864 [Pistacia integerrima]|uniref:Uncharacterized protein n=1 Tax=Pistacia integerrima TaxID=434235 RepID=A0ACC0X565_9ROSI|nr:hypothetical protein Pint_32864 [Pistacia integerrima]